MIGFTVVEEDTSQVVFPSEDSSGVLRSCTAIMEALVGMLNTKPLDVKAKACHGTPSVEISQNKRGEGLILESSGRSEQKGA